MRLSVANLKKLQPKKGNEKEIAEATELFMSSVVVVRKDSKIHLFIPTRNDEKIYPAYTHAARYTAFCTVYSREPENEGEMLSKTGMFIPPELRVGKDSEEKSKKFQEVPK